MFNKISQHQPTYEKGIYEFQQIANVENSELASAKTQFDKVLLNQFVLTADANGLAMFEKLYNIVPVPDDDLEFRRQRILNRTLLQPPFTETFLRTLLDSLLGKDLYELRIDYANYIIYIKSFDADQKTKNEVSILIDKIKPANMVYVSEPLLVYNLLEGETITKQDGIFYNLGTNWILGKNPFRVFGPVEVFKMPGIHSITDTLLEETATFVEGQIDKVIINESVTITNFTTKQAVDNEVELEYEVTNLMGVNNITRIQICKSDGTALTDVTTYIPVVGQVSLNHKIRIAEGA